MKKQYLKTVFTFIALMATSVFFAQDYSFKDYNWNEKENTIEVPANYKDEKEVILNRTSKIEVVVDKNTAIQYRLIHEKRYINSDDAIERNNKIYIPFGGNENILVTKARVILKSGKVITLDKKDIKEEVDEEKGMKYNYFAVNGLEKGAVIEKLYIIEEAPDLKGNTIKMQDEYPIAVYNFELITPAHLFFKTKSYNGLSEPVLDEKKFEKKKVLTITEKDIIALKDDEQYSNWDVKLKLFRYKMDANAYTGARNINSFKEYATNTYELLNPVLDKKQEKAIATFCSSIPESKDAQEQIWNIENKIKKTIIYDKYIDAKETLSDVIKTKQANSLDILKLYTAVFKYFKIEQNLVFTSNRYKIPFDKDFESYENLNDFIFYFPAIKKYLSPTEIEYRIPLFPNYLGNNNGLFIKEKVFAGIPMGIGEINFIEIPGTEITHDFMDITVDFTKDLENPSITSRMTYGGYSGLNFQPLKDFISADQYKTMLKNVSENYTLKAECKTLTTENDGIDFIGKKPYIMNLTFDGKDMIQKAGGNYLFSVGQTIGSQMEFYQENKRMLPIEIDYPHYYTRKIKIILPQGATIKNLDKFVMDYKTQLNGKTEAAFISNYSQNKNEVTIENTEFYNIINYPLASFDEYKAVINAAADFNKIVVVVTQ
ncbi:DUF3857 domain-containing protein [Flavobacterium sp. ANB]|uniref:DUF3857 domain-containing protein n=1 Tax=unclassified Flavobacterium TaxID=196869 RepID=UPI0012B7193D|nr:MULTISPECIES: DUF3857 domain-containing protein [unclassified Flavobacterium]MBF4516428.1 DUF3857 domain-containing protein [Flavobacterium sp. ANB]MTD69675.1 DUF3857 domain-containing protein [Flavobacterium sp. LC2016-13]